MAKNKKLGFWKRLTLITAGVIALATAPRFISSNADYPLRSPESPAPLVIAHGRASASAPGNTREAFEKAVEQGADMIELDLRRTKDNVYVAFHDAELGEKLVSEMTYEELNRATSSKVPKLENVLKDFGGEVGFNIDLKETGYEPDVLKFLLQYLPENRFMITSQYADSIRKIEAKKPEVQTGWIMLKGSSRWGNKFRKKRNAIRTNPGAYLEDAIDAGADFVAPDYRFVSPEFLEYAKRKGLGVIPWTLNNREQIKRFLEYAGVYGIITDKPDLAREAINGK